MSGDKFLDPAAPSRWARSWGWLLLLAVMFVAPPSTYGGKAAKPDQDEPRVPNVFEVDPVDTGLDGKSQDSACACCPPRLWFSAQNLIWWIDGFWVPPLVTTGPANADRDTAGEPGQPGTEILLGDRSFAGEAHYGGRFRLGYWFDAEATCGVEASYLGLLQTTTTFGAASPELPVIAHPFYNMEPGREGPDTELVAYPGLFDGRIEVAGETDLQGIEVLYRHALSRACGTRIDFLAGWRYARLDEQLLISDFKRSVGSGSGLQIGTTVEEYERFAALNQFHGGEIGLLAEWRRCRWTLETVLKLALGGTRSQANIQGSTTVSVPDPDVAISPTGLLVQETNRGSYQGDSFAVVPELGVALGYQLTPRLRTNVGYTFLYWSQVARPGDQIDLDLNPTQLQPGGLVGAPRPAFDWKFTDMWAQGISLGLDYRF